MTRTGGSDIAHATVRQDRAVLPGRVRAASLMRSLGKDADAVWAALTPDEAQLIADEMQHLPPDNPGSADRTLAALIEGRPDFSPGGSPNPVWAQLNHIPARDLADFLAAESPQIAALVLSRISPSAAGAAVRAMPETQALDILHRMVAPSCPIAGAIPAIEATLAAWLDRKDPARESGSQHVAAMFDSIGSVRSAALLEALDASDRSTGAHIRAMLVPFESLADFPPAAIQTLLAAINHDTLVLALKGASEPVISAVFANMTQRAGAVVKDEMTALGPIPRSDVERARSSLMAIARDLIGRGEIRLGQDMDDGDLVE
ncbi:MAG: FliG C-terminal domain-containing protein [Pseudomonadota bacterium]